MIIIFYAFAREVSVFKKRLRNRRPISVKQLRGFQTELEGVQVVAIPTGMGMARAGDAVRKAFEAFPDAVLSIGTGVAGALSNGLQPGDLVLADRILFQEENSSRVQQVDHHAGRHIQDVARRLRSAELKFSTGAIFTAQGVLNGIAAKREAKNLSGAIAVDMETAAIAREAERCGVPFVCLRAVLEAVDDEIVTAPAIDEHGRVRPLSAGAHFMRNPKEVLHLPRMMRNLTRAARSLAEALPIVISGLHSRATESDLEA